MKKYLLNFKFIFFVYILLAVGASLQSYFGAPTTFNNFQYTSYNNYIIFKQSFFHLIENKDLFISYPPEHWDLYKYSPTFALLMAPMAVLPDAIGLTIWNLLNVLVLFFAVKKIPFKTNLPKVFILFFIIIELLTSLQNEQSNALMVGLMILGFYFLEKEKIWLGCLCIALTVYIKLFGLVAFALFLIYGKKEKFILASVTWMVVLAALPLLVISFEQLQFLYASWWKMLSNDHSTSYGLSVMGWMENWFGLGFLKNKIVLLGVVLFCLPLVKIKSYSNYEFRWRLLVSILLWVVIFNHKAESPTFIIAICGVGMWYFFSSPKGKVEKNINLGLVILAFVFTSLSPTDVFPRVIRESYVIPFVLKAVPCIFIWGKLIYEMCFVELLRLEDTKIET